MGLNLSTNLPMFVYTFQAMWRHRPLKECSVFVGIRVACTFFSLYTLGYANLQLELKGPSLEFRGRIFKVMYDFVSLRNCISPRRVRFCEWICGWKLEKRTVFTIPIIKTTRTNSSQKNKGKKNSADDIFCSSSCFYLNSQLIPTWIKVTHKQP